MKKINSYETLVDVIEIRENHYEKYLGKLDQPILSPTEKIYPHIEIYQIAPTPQKPYWTLITNGMSGAKQNIPLDNKRTSGRTERVCKFFCVNGHNEVNYSIYRKEESYDHSERVIGRAA